MARRHAILLFATLALCIAGAVLPLPRNDAESAGMVGTEV
jgi:hypothetical protein